MTGSRNYLFTLWEGGGTVPPEIELARRLIARGHRVTVLGDPTIEAEALAAGCSFAPWRQAPHRSSRRAEHDFVKDYELASPFALASMIEEQLLIGPAERFAQDVDAQLELEAYDALVSDCMVFGAQIAAEARKLPCAVVMANAYFLPAPGIPPFGLGWQPARGPLGRVRDRALHALTTALWNRGLGELNAIRGRRGLCALGSVWQQFDRAQQVLVLTSTAFDFPGQLPSNVRHVGAVLDDPSWAQPCAAPEGDAPLVVVGFSSTFQNQAAVLQRVADALAGLPVRAVLTTGHAVDPEQIVAGPNVKVVRTAAHAPLLAQAQLCITHGGHGTLLKALAHGVPVLCMPMGRDQPDNAARLTASGAGLRLSARASTARIAAAVRELLSERYRRAAREMQEKVAQDARTDAALRALEALPAQAATPLSASASPLQAVQAFG